MVSDLIVRVPCVACGAWFNPVGNQGWACPKCSARSTNARTAPAAGSERVSDPTRVNDDARSA